MGISKTFQEMMPKETEPTYLFLNAYHSDGSDIFDKLEKWGKKNKGDFGVR